MTMWFEWFFLLLNAVTVPLHMYNLMWLTREEASVRQYLRRPSERRYLAPSVGRTVTRWLLFILTVAALYATIGIAVYLTLILWP